MVETRVPPNNLEAEDALLGCMILAPKTIDDLQQYVDAEDFYRPSNQYVFNALSDMRFQGIEIDQLSLADYLSHKVNPRDPKESLLDMVGGSYRIIELSDAVPAVSNYGRYARIIKRASTMRKLIDIGNEIAASAYEDDDDEDAIVSKAMSLVGGVSLAVKDEPESVAKVSDRIWKRINSGEVVQYFTPHNLPKVRLVPKDLVVIGAGASVGKTAITLDWASEWARTKQVAYFEYEMSEDDLLSRLICKHAGVTIRQIQDCDFSAEELLRVQDAMYEIGKLNLRLKEVWCDNHMLFAKIRQEAASGTEIVVIDHLGLVPFKKPSGRTDAKAIGTELTNPLKRLASELGITIIGLVQLNRDGQDPSRFPILRNLRESGEIEQDASVVIMLWSDKGLDGDIGTRTRLREDSGVLKNDELLRDDFNLVRVSVSKFRNGELGHKYLVFNGNNFRYEDRSPVLVTGSQKEIDYDD